MVTLGDSNFIGNESFKDCQPALHFSFCDSARSWTPERLSVYIYIPTATNQSSSFVDKNDKE